MKSEKIFMGIDEGTNSIGWAVTDDHYNVIKKNSKALWGAYLFDEAETQADRRLKRSSRRRIQRRKWRILLLQDIFSKEINQVDPYFFRKLETSFCKLEDKESNTKYNLFNDSEYNDINYYSNYPTIYHLRDELIKNDKKYDIRLVYLALHHMIKYRGHFTFENDTFNSADTNFKEMLDQINDCIDPDQSKLNLVDMNEELLYELFTSSKTRSERKKLLIDFFHINKDKNLIAIISLLCGLSVKTRDLFDDDELVIDKEQEKIDITSATFMEQIPQYESLLGDNINLVYAIKNLYDYIILKRLLGDNSTISEAMIARYNKHDYDLKELKNYVMKNFPSKYSRIFRDSSVNANYPNYVGSNMTNNKKEALKHSNREDFYNFIKKELSLKFGENEYVDSILLDMENNNYLPRLNCSENGVFPFQLNLNEMKIILKTQSKYYSFLNEKDEYGTTSDKIISLLNFRIPYYVGPLNPNSKFAWIKKNKKGKIYPWNFNDIVDIDNTAISFINHLRESASHCTYLWDCETLPKNSLLFQRFDLYSHINKVYINGQFISHDDKIDVINNLFLTQKKVTKQQFENFFKTKYGNNVSITSSQDKALEEISFSLSSEITFRNIFGNDFNNNIDMIEDIIKEIAIFEDKNILYKRLLTVYHLSEDKAKQIKGFNAKGFCSLSRKLLNELTTEIEIEYGEIVDKTIIQLLEETNLSLIEIINSPKYSFNETIKKYNDCNEKITYEIIDKLPTSPANKRGIWSTIKLVDEVESILGKPINKFFIECTRHDKEKGSRKDSRKKDLEVKYQAVKNTFNEIDLLTKDDYAELLNQLEGFESERFKQKKLFLYFTQLGKCMYSGDTIDIKKLFTNEYDIDHIIPQALLKDDSIDNTVLVKHYINKDKDKDYPLTDGIVSSKARKLWRYLKDCNLISDSKLSKLQRTTELSDDELASFINRQIVCTNQTVKMVIKLLKDRNKDCEVVWSKAENVSDFRNKFNIYKCREINDLHHVHDAYLNVVVGNIFNTKYGYQMNAKKYAEMKNDKSNKGEKSFSTKVKNIYHYPVYNHDYFAWEPDKTINLIKEQISHHDMNVTYKPTTNTGAFYKETVISPKLNKTMIALKQKGIRSDASKYGGYTNQEFSHFAIISYEKKKKVDYAIVSVPVMMRTHGNDNIVKYIESLGYQNVTIINYVMKNIVIKTNDFEYLIRGETERQIAVQSFWSNDQTKYIKNMLKLLDKNPDIFLDKDEYVIHKPNEDGIAQGITEIVISKVLNIKLYDDIINKFSKKPFLNCSTLYKIILKLEEEKERFINLSLLDQVKVIYNFLKIQSAKPSRGDLSLLGLSSDCGRIVISSILDGTKIISRSITGYYEHIIWEKK